MSKIIISFTSYPARISTIDKVLDSIIKQTVLPDKIILYLSSDEFRYYKDIPDLEKYDKYGFEIHWNKENLKSHKKWFYALQEYPNDVIITIDDDISYKDTMIEELLTCYRRHPKAVIARRVHLITCQKDGSIAAYDKWWSGCNKYVGTPRMDLVAIGCQGILYPPHIFNDEVFNKRMFMEKVPYADDLWLKVMELYSGIATVLSNQFCDDPILEECKNTGLYLNQNADGGNDVQLMQALDEYNEYYGKDDLLTDRLFLTGKIMQSDYKEIRKKDMYKAVFQYFEEIRNEDEILIYGAGAVAKRLYIIFRKLDWIKKIKAIIVRDKKENVERIGEVRVRNYRDFLYSSEKIIIGLWDTKQKEIYETLILQGVDSTRIIKLTPVLNRILIEIMQNEEWVDSADYWEKRYVEGGNSGEGSYNRLAQFKADVINKFVEENEIKFILEWGCGDGNQLSLAKYPQYLGYDISKKAISICQKRFVDDKSKKFLWCGDKDFVTNIKADLAISLDVIYHLVEDNVYNIYMKRLFNSSKKYVCIYSCNFDKSHAQHVRCRRFTDYVEQNYSNWELIKYFPNKYPYNEKDPDNTSWSDFFFYKFK